MQHQSVQSHVRQFLCPLNAISNAEAIVEHVAAVAEKDEKLSAVVDTAVAWVDMQRSMFHRQHSDDNDKETDLDDVTITLLSAWVMRSETVLTDPSLSVSNVVKRVTASGVAGFHQFAASVEDDFLATLFSELQTRSAQDDVFEKRFASVRTDVSRMLGNTERLREHGFSDADLRSAPAPARARQDVPLVAIYVAIFLVGLALGLSAAKGSPQT